MIVTAWRSAKAEQHQCRRTHIVHAQGRHHGVVVAHTALQLAVKSIPEKATLGSDVDPANASSLGQFRHSARSGDTGPSRTGIGEVFFYCCLIDRSAETKANSANYPTRPPAQSPAATPLLGFRCVVHIRRHPRAPPSSSAADSPRRRHRQVDHAHAGGAGDGVADRRRCGGMIGTSPTPRTP